MLKSFGLFNLRYYKHLIVLALPVVLSSNDAAQDEAFKNLAKEQVLGQKFNQENNHNHFRDADEPAKSSYGNEGLEDISHSFALNNYSAAKNHEGSEIESEIFDSFIDMTPNGTDVEQKEHRSSSNEVIDDELSSTWTCSDLNLQISISDFEMKSCDEFLFETETSRELFLNESFAYFSLNERTILLRSGTENRHLRNDLQAEIFRIDSPGNDSGIETMHCSRASSRMSFYDYQDIQQESHLNVLSEESNYSHSNTENEILNEETNELISVHERDMIFVDGENTVRKKFKENGGSEERSLTYDEILRNSKTSSAKSTNSEDAFPVNSKNLSSTPKQNAISIEEIGPVDNELSSNIEPLQRCLTFDEISNILNTDLVNTDGEHCDPQLNSSDIIFKENSNLDQNKEVASNEYLNECVGENNFQNFESTSPENIYEESFERINVPEDLDFDLKNVVDIQRTGKLVLNDHDLVQNKSVNSNEKNNCTLPEQILDIRDEKTSETSIPLKIKTQNPENPSGFSLNSHSNSDHENLSEKRLISSNQATEENVEIFLENRTAQGVLNNSLSIVSEKYLENECNPTVELRNEQKTAECSTRTNRSCQKVSLACSSNVCSIGSSTEERERFHMEVISYSLSSHRDLLNSENFSFEKDFFNGFIFENGVVPSECRDNLYLPEKETSDRCIGKIESGSLTLPLLTRTPIIDAEKNQNEKLQENKIKVQDKSGDLYLKIPSVSKDLSDKKTFSDNSNTIKKKEKKTRIYDSFDYFSFSDCDDYKGLSLKRSSRKNKRSKPVEEKKSLETVKVPNKNESPNNLNGNERNKDFCDQTNKGLLFTMVVFIFILPLLIIWGLFCYFIDSLP